jgi:serine/threonine protein kinase/tetratricopeptide (TPR) repeat protein
LADIPRALHECLGARYALQEGSHGPALLGAGGMALVYRARDLRHDRDVALKVLRPEISASVGTERFLREIRLTAQLQHPAILPLFDSGAATTGDGVPLMWYAMPLIEGESLRDRLRREGRLPLSEALALIAQAADALEYAHQHGIVHRDVKPENILLSSGHPLIADFGIARALSGGTGNRGDDAAAGALTATGVSIGTPAYMSPEQAAGAPEVDARSDVYALGCVLFEMLAGEPPFTGASPAVVIGRRFSETAPSLATRAAGVPPHVEAAVARALARDPAERFGTAGEFARALSAASPAPATTVDRKTPRGRSRAALLLLAIAALVTSGLVLARRWSVGRVRPEAPVTLAVLPFRALTKPEQEAALGIGIPDAIITRMAGLRGLRVRPTSAILAYENPALDPREAGRTLQAEYVVTGTLQRAGERLRVSVQLVRVGDGAPIWASRYDLTRADLLQLQDSIAARVSTALEIRIGSAEEARLYRRYTDNVAAYELFLRGRAQLARVTRASTLAAIAAFERAIALDSTYTLAWAGLAMASADMHLRFAADSDVAAWGERARREAERALTLDSTVAEAHLAMAAVARKTEFDWDVTLEASRRALALNPSLEAAHYFRSAAFYHLGLLRQSAAELGAAMEVNPESSVERVRTESVLAFLSGDFARAARLGDEVRRASGEQVADFYRAEAYLFAGDTSRAAIVLDTLIRSSSASGRSRGTAVRAAMMARKEPGRARALLDSLVASSHIDHHVAYTIGDAYAQLGDASLAVSWLERAAQQGFACYPWTVRDPLLQPIRGDPVYTRWLATLRSRWQGLEARYPEGG